MNRVQAVLAAAATTALATAAIAATAAAQGVFNDDSKLSQSGSQGVPQGTPQVIYRDLDPVFVDRLSGEVVGQDSGTAAATSYELVSAQDSGDSWDDDDHDDDHDKHDDDHDKHHDKHDDDHDKHHDDD